MKQRNKLGDRAACEVCDLDIEWHGKRRKRNDSSILSDQVTYGWTDRGGNHFCDEGGGARWDENGALVKMPHTLHKPYRGN